MKISKHSLIELADGQKLLLVDAKRIGGRDFCLLSTTATPIEMQVAEIQINNGNAQIRDYVGSNYKEILFALLQN
ncbi:MAG: hypothetical protein FWE38_02375 [Firmicutes bacterium]|nr:hypothetical protein [Bacillota bacterium]